MLRERQPIAGRKNATGQAKRVKMDGGCITPNHATDMAMFHNVERIRYKY
jgi:hypothetical protein